MSSCQASILVLASILVPTSTLVLAYELVLASILVPTPTLVLAFGVPEFGSSTRLLLAVVALRLWPGCLNQRNLTSLTHLNVLHHGVLWLWPGFSNSTGWS